MGVHSLMMAMKGWNCDKCGGRVPPGGFPFCKGRVADHERPLPHRPFIPYFDEHISHEGAYITSDRQREKLMKKENLYVKDRKHPDDQKRVRREGAQR